MENLTLEPFGNLIITFLGIFTPLLTILMNISKEGVRLLESKHKTTKRVMEADLSQTTQQQDSIQRLYRDMQKELRRKFLGTRKV